MKLAVCNCYDTGPFESLRLMLGSAGYECRTLSAKLARRLDNAGLECVGRPEETCRREGVSRLGTVVSAEYADLEKADLFVDVKAQRNYLKVVAAFPWLAGRVLWYRINGGRPEHLVRKGKDMGDEINPSCPILTPNRWYAQPGPWSARAYSCWPPYARASLYANLRPTRSEDYGPPLSMIHNPAGWGYGEWCKKAATLGVRVHGINTPGGVIFQDTLPGLLSKAVCYVHLKQNDAPGYALYEALSAGCPVLITQRLVEHSAMHDLFGDGVACLHYETFANPADAWGLLPTGTTSDAVLGSMMALVERLRSDPAENARIGEAGRQRLRELMWDAERDGPAFAEWLGRMFP